MSIDALPQTPYRWLASTDPKRQNADYLLLKPDETRRIRLPKGTLLRLWSTSLFPEKTTLILQNKKPIVLLKNGKAGAGELYEKALTLYPSVMQNNLRVLSDNAALIVTNNAKEENKFFYQAAILEAPQLIPVNDPAPPDKWEKKIEIAAGGESVFWEAKNAGVIDEIKIAFNQAPADWNAVRLIAKWDANARENTVDVPLGALMANFYGAFPAQSSLWKFDGKTLQLRWMMDFGKGARLSLKNNGAQNLSLSTQVLSRAAQNSSRRFYARFGKSQTQKGQPLDILQVQGKGSFLGFSLGIKPTAQSRRRSFAYLEGNEKIVADTNTYEGTGTEDFFNSAWYFPKKPFAREFHGVTFKQDLPPQVSAYRLMIPDAVPFQKSLKVTLEHGKNNNSDDLEYSWVAYWYAENPSTFHIEERATPATQSGAAALEAASRGEDDSALNKTLAASLALVLGGLGALVLRKKLAPKNDANR